jgi:SnoaL-like polyketide cyclase
MPIDEAERKRRRELLAAHMQPENGHDVDGVMETFSEGADVVYNGIPFPTPDAIRQIHVALGFDAQGALEGLRVNPEREHFTDDEIVIEGHLSGRHVGPFFGFEPTGRDVRIPYFTFYRFDAAGKLASERVVLNLGALSGWAG